MTIGEQYEILAAAYYKRFGQMAPGKDPGPVQGELSERENFDRWIEWLKSDEAHWRQLAMHRDDHPIDKKQRFKMVAPIQSDEQAELRELIDGLRAYCGITPAKQRRLADLIEPLLTGNSGGNDEPD